MSKSATTFRPLLALVAALLGAPLAAAEVGDNAKRNASSKPQAEIPWMSGGIGDEARDEMRKATASYNVHIIFSTQQGSYLANVPFSVSRRSGSDIISGVSEGPLLYIKLPPATYRISAKIDGAWQSKQIQVGGADQQMRTAFVSKGE